MEAEIRGTFSVRRFAGVGKTRIEIDKGAKLSLGEKIQNRGTLYIGCKNKGKVRIGGHCFLISIRPSPV